MKYFATYTLSQWLLLFYIYCFLGWVWECCYVSARIHKWTNRGFMHGPLLPIYGSGAIVMLFATLPVKNNAFLVFIVASLAATVLEYCTGEVMESLFKVRYWDYTRYKLNFRGHICLVASLAWGTGGVIITYIVNKPIEALVLGIPTRISELIAFAITVAAACDFGASFREAMDMRDLLIRLSEGTDRRIRNIGKRVDVMVAVYGSDLERGAAQVKEKGKEYVEEIKSSGQEHIEKLLARLDEMPELQKMRLRRYMEANPDAESRHGAISELLAVLKEKKDDLLDKTAALKERFDKKEES